jgi:hypothetical protein
MRCPEDIRALRLSRLLAIMNPGRSASSSHGKPFEKGNRNGGRPKGSPNKISRDLKEAYLMAANLAGGEEGLVGYLKTQALQGNPSPFMAGLAKLLP